MDEFLNANLTRVADVSTSFRMMRWKTCRLYEIGQCLVKVLKGNLYLMGHKHGEGRCEKLDKDVL